MKITIFGFAGSGTSTVGKLLAQELDYTFMSSGNILRSWAEESGYTIYEFEDKVVKTDHSFDMKLDTKVAEF
jgi:cytidylate kinase